ncbi:MAG: ABC transporter substrate-binding protein [Bacteroidaceae bacterium]|nr:ABC transporter substrate-binding protein [Bacteroidaceae bacterium]
MRKLKIIFLCTALFLFSVATVTAVLQHNKPSRFVLSTNWTAQSQFAGYIVAAEEGFFRDNGLDVTLHFHDSVHSSQEMLMSGKADFAVMHLLDALEARSKGERIVNVLQPTQISSYCIVSHHHIQNIDDLGDQEVALWHRFNPAIQSFIDQQTQGHVQFIEIFGGIEAFLAGAVENTMCTTHNELLQLEESGMLMDSACVLTFQELGLDILDDGLYVEEDFYYTHREEVEAFVQAVKAGWERAFAEPDRATDLVLQTMGNYRLRRNFYHERRGIGNLQKLITSGKAQADMRLKESDFLYAMELLNVTGHLGEFRCTYQEFCPNLP